MTELPTETTLPRFVVYQALETEIAYVEAMAAKAHGDPGNDFAKSLENFVLYMEDYIQELRHQLSRTWGPEAYTGALNTLRKVTALGVRAMEVHGAVPRTAPTKHAQGVDLTGG